MRKKLFLLLVVSLFISVSAFAEMIVLKTGQKIEGELIGKTDEYIKIDFMGVSCTYYFDEIESINGEKLVVATAKPEVLTQQKLPFSTAIITYEYKGWQQGTEIAYIDGINNKIAIEKHTTSTLPFSTESEDEMELYDGETYYSLSLTKKMGIKEEKKGDAIPIIFNEKMYNGYQIESKKLLGKDCSVYKLPTGYVYFWEGIKLEEVKSQYFGKEYKYTKEAVGIQLDVTLPEDKFRIPAGIKILTKEEAMKDLAGKFEQMGMSQ